MYNNLKSRVKKLETVITGEPFTIPIFPPFILENIHSVMDSWGIDHNRVGQVALITMGDGVKGVLEFDPQKLDLVEKQLRIINQDYLSTPQKHTPERIYNL